MTRGAGIDRGIITNGEPATQHCTIPSQFQNTRPSAPLSICLERAISSLMPKLHKDSAVHLELKMQVALTCSLLNIRLASGDFMSQPLPPPTCPRCL